MDTKVNDNGRRWLWGFLAVIVMLQFYVVRELLAAFAVFAVGFAAIAFAVAGLYLLQNCCRLGLARLANIRQPVINMTPGSRENREAA